VVCTMHNSNCCFAIRLIFKCPEKCQMSFQQQVQQVHIDVSSVQDEPHDKAFQAWLKENRTIACPTCGQGLQKQEGCNHLQYVPQGLLVVLCLLASALLPTVLRSLATCRLPAAHCRLFIALFAQCCRPPVPSVPTSFAYYATLICPALYSLVALCLFLPAPPVVAIF